MSIPDLLLHIDGSHGHGGAIETDVTGNVTEHTNSNGDKYWNIPRSTTPSSVSVPLDTPPASLIVRYVDRFLTTTFHAAHLHGPGTFYEGRGEITYDNGRLSVISPQESIRLVGLLAFSEELASGEARVLMVRRPWTWASVQPYPPALPAYRSSLYVLTPRIHHATIDNRIGEDITRHIIDADVDSDIDRAGAKGRIALSSTAPWAVKAGQWVAPFLRVLPETGDPVEAQLGLYELGEPQITEDEIGPGIATNSGEDVIHRLYRSVTRSARYTKRVRTTGTPLFGANVMATIRHELRIASVPVFGPNVIPNSGFEDAGAGWNDPVAQAGWSATIQPADNQSYFDRYAFRAASSASAAAGSYGVIVETRIPVPAGAQRMYVGHWGVVNNLNIRTRCDIRFYNAAGDGISGVAIGGVWNPHQRTNQWEPFLHWGDVPADAVDFAVWVFAYDQPGGTAGGVGWVDNVMAGAMVGEPLDRHALPDDDRMPSTNISHAAGERWTTRINDQLTALGYHALHATPEGRPTTRPLRNPRTDEPARTYTIGRDARLVGEVVTDRSASNLYNTVVVVKEDYQAETAMVASASNDDPDHPWSTVNVGVIASPQETVTSDAVDQAALQDIADERLARASMQETLQIEVLPDPGLGSHDVIEIAGTDGRAAGRWAIESIRWGLTATDPLVRIGARRVITSGEAT